MKNGLTKDERVLARAFGHGYKYYLDNVSSASASAHVLNVPIFRASAAIFFCSGDLQNLNNLLQATEDDISDAAGWASGNFTDGWATIFFSSKDTDAEVISHESVHFVNMLFGKIGYKPDVSNDEVQAYLTGWVVKNFTDMFELHKKIKE